MSVKLRRHFSLAQAKDGVHRSCYRQELPRGSGSPLVNRRHALYLPMLPRQIANLACSGHGHVACGVLATLVGVQMRQGAAAVSVHGHGLIVDMITYGRACAFFVAYQNR